MVNDHVIRRRTANPNNIANQVMRYYVNSVTIEKHVAADFHRKRPVLSSYLSEYLTIAGIPCEDDPFYCHLPSATRQLVWWSNGKSR